MRTTPTCNNIIITHVTVHNDDYDDNNNNNNSKNNISISPHAPNSRVKNYYSVIFEVLTAVTMKNVVFWDVAPCRCCVNRRFGRTYRLDLQRNQREQMAAAVYLPTYLPTYLPVTPTWSIGHP
jgi:hypothetical protein